MSVTPSLPLLILGAVTVQVGFGAYPVVLKEFSKEREFNSVVFSFVRDFLCFPVLLLFSSCIENNATSSVNKVSIIGTRLSFLCPRHKYDISLFTALGFLGCWGNQLCYILGLYCSSADVAAMWQPSIPVWTVLIATMFGLEPYPSRDTEGALKVVGISLAIIGALVMNSAEGSASVSSESTGSSKPRAGANPALGNTFFIFQTLFQALYILLQKSLIFGKYGVNRKSDDEYVGVSQIEMSELDQDDDSEPSQTSSKSSKRTQSSRRLSSKTSRLAEYRSLFEYWKEYPIHVTAWSYLAGSFFQGVSCLFGAYYNISIFNFGVGTETNTLSLPSQAIVPLIYAIFISSALCYGLITWLNKYIPSSLVTVFWPLQIPVAVSLSELSGLGSISLQQTFGGVAIAIGLFCVMSGEYLKQRKIGK